MGNQTKTTYVYRGTEVILTGRKASRQGQNQPTRRNAGATSEEVLFEIVPADPENGTWSSWVKKEELYIIISDNRENCDNESV